MVVQSEYDIHDGLKAQETQLTWETLIGLIKLTQINEVELGVRQQVQSEMWFVLLRCAFVM